MLTNTPAKVDAPAKPAMRWEDAPWMPELEMFTKDDLLHVRLDVPGMTKENVGIEVTDEHLVVRGERTQEKEEKKEGFYKTERTYGSFYRMVPLPEGAKSDAATATMKDGVLEITMPIEAAAAKGRRLEIAEPAAVTTKAA